MLLETICIKNGAIQHLAFHQARLDRSRAALFDKCAPIDLAGYIHPPSGEGTLKCRVLYEREILDINYQPYRPRSVRRLKTIDASPDYAHKYSDREVLEDLFARRGDADDILIVRDGLITDTSIANIAFLKKGRWYTPKRPLLRGTTRERLVRSGFLIPRDIGIEEIDTYEAFALLNAMIGFEIVKNGKIV